MKTINNENYGWEDHNFNFDAQLDIDLQEEFRISNEKDIIRDFLNALDEDSYDEEIHPEEENDYDEDDDKNNSDIIEDDRDNENNPPDEDPNENDDFEKDPDENDPLYHLKTI